MYCLALQRDFRGYSIFKALQLGKVSQVAPIDKLSVALTIVLAFIFLKEPITMKEIVGAGLIIGGTLVLIIK